MFHFEMLIWFIHAVAERQQKFELEETANQASAHFLRAEQMSSAVPFTWVFIKPPWAAGHNSVNIKSCVFQNFKVWCGETNSKVILPC